MAEDYTKIERPFDNLLQREEDLPYVLGDDSSTTQADTNGAVEEQAVKEGGAMNDLWISNFIRSTNWKPKSLGFYMEGRTGYAEFSNVYVVGDIVATTITASSGTIGGFTIGATTLSGGTTLVLSSESTGTITGGIFQTATSGERIVISSATKKMSLIDSGGSTIGSFAYGTGASSGILDLRPLSGTSSAIYIATSTATNPLIQLLNQNGSGTTPLVIEDDRDGVGSCLILTRQANTATDGGVKVINMSTVTNSSTGSIIYLDFGTAGDSKQHFFRFPSDATDPTAGGGAASGRIPIMINGVKVYLAYY